MDRRRHHLLAVALAALLLATGSAFAQQDANVQRGFAPDKLYNFGNLDSVNLFNGNLTLTIPIGPTFRVNGTLSYGLTLVYNSKIWDIVSAATSTPGVFAPFADLSKSDNAGAGWRLTLGELQAPSYPGNYLAQWKYIGEDGAEHSLYSTLHIGETETTGVYYSRDGSYLRMKKVSGTVFEVEFPDGTIRQFTRGTNAAPSPFKLTQIRDRFGNKLDVSYETMPDNRWKLKDVYRTHYVYFKTVANRTVVDRVELAAFNGTTAVYPFTYASPQNSWIHENCQDVNDNSATMRTVPLLIGVGLPAGAGSYVMNHSDYFKNCYDDDFPQVPLEDLPGVLHRIKLPTLGTLEWTYQMYSYPSRGIFTPGEPSLELVKSLGVKTKTMKNNTSPDCVPLGGVGCTWTYAPAQPAPTVRTRTVTFPTGDQTVYYFNTIFGLKTGTDPNPALRWTGWDYGLPYTLGTTSGTGFFLSQEIYSGSAAPTNLKRSIYVGYEHDRLPTVTNDPQDWYNTNRRVVREKTEYKDDGTIYGDVVYSKFDGLGHYRRSVTGGNFAASNVRTEHTEFNPNQGDYYVDPATNVQSSGYTPWGTGAAWVIDTSTESWAQEGSTTLKSKTCFESATGFLSWKRTCGDGGCNLATDVLAVYSRDTGNVSDEQYFGGDSGGLPATAQNSVCSLANLPSTDYWLHHDYSFGSRSKSFYKQSGGTAMTFNVLELAIDPSTGLPKTSTDPSLVTTDYEYDTLGRLLWSKPKSGHGAWTEYVYAAASGSVPTKVTIRQRPNGSPNGSPLAEAEVQFDPFGRVWRDRKKLPGVGWTHVDTDRNSMGWIHTVSERTTANTPVEYTKYLSYDPFGRARTIRPPDTGGSHDVIVAYTGVRRIDRKVMVATGYDPATGAVTETQQITSEFYDRQGRLFRVLEPPLGVAAATETKYTYDPAGRLTQVTMGPQGGAAVQTRTFSYDNRGFLQWENHPEKTANVFQQGHDVDYRSYDALGHAGRRIDGANDLTFTFDRAERLTQVRETGGQARVLKAFTYATSNDPNNWKKAKVVSATRYNYVIHNGTPVTVQATESYTYGEVAGRMSKRDLQFYTGVAVSESFTQSWTYNDLGQVATADYPKCTIFAACNPTVAAPRTVTYGYTDGSLTSIAGFTGTVPGQPTGIGITYHQNGMVNQVAHGNGMTDTQAVDPHLMRRPASFTSKFGAATRWASGSYTYDGSGNVAKVGSGTGKTAWYTYDELSRLKTGTVFTGATGGGTQKQQTYTYDPYGNITDIAGSPGRATPTTPGTNRLTSGTYDAAGNLTDWNRATYAYDAFNMMWHMTSGSEDWLYIYNADDERIWSFKVGGVFSRWSLRGLGNEVLRDFTATNGTYAVEKDYIYRDGQLLASENPTAGSRRHYHLDHLGTPRLITNGSGAQAAYHVYYPFGEEATGISQDSERMKFTGHERDLGNATSAADDLDYMHARHASPLTSRFLSCDPASSSARREIPQSWNRYAYAKGNPVKYVDPTGESIWTTTFRVFKQLGKGKNLRRIEIAVIRENSKQKSLRRIENSLKGISSSERAQGAKRVLQVENDEVAKKVGKQLSSDGEVRKIEQSGGKASGYPEHRNPSEGEYSDVHIETAQKASLTVGGVIAAIGAVASPAQTAVIESGDPSPGELASAAAWDAVSAVDPTGISDLINWLVGVP